MTVRGVRGATTVKEDRADLILEATQELLAAILKENPSMQSTDIASAIFSLTVDLNSIFPAQAARQMGWDEVPLFCTQEIPVPNSLPRCIRVLILWNTEISQGSIKHVYLREAVRLRPDFASTIIGGASC